MGLGHHPTQRLAVLVVLVVAALGQEGLEAQQRQAKATTAARGLAAEVVAAVAHLRLAQTQVPILAEMAVLVRPAAFQARQSLAQAVAAGVPAPQALVAQAAAARARPTRWLVHLERPTLAPVAAAARFRSKEAPVARAS